MRPGLSFSAILALVFFSTSSCLVRGLSDAGLKAISQSVDPADFDIKTGQLLSPLLHPRVPGTPGHEAVEAHLAGFFDSLNRDGSQPAWKIEWQNSTATTPLDNHRSKVPFRNLIATLDRPNSNLDDSIGGGRLVLAAHYDSKITPKGFIGATDSAAPCAMLLHAARDVGNRLRHAWTSPSTANSSSSAPEPLGLQIIFLDGEEAFVQWSATDSLYGARALVANWEKTGSAAGSPSRSRSRTPVGAIDLLVLLDLLGSENPSIPSFYRTTHWAYRQLSTLESRLQGLAKTGETGFESSGRKKRSNGRNSWFPDHDVPTGARSSAMDGGIAIEDDHLPFLAAGVEVLHIIPAPFPAVWHEMTDDGEHLHMPTVRDWARLVTAFAADWFGVES